MKQNTRGESTDELLRLVADRRRRAVLNHLRENGGGPVTLDELVDSISGDGPDATGTQAGVGPLELQLRHVHLPKLVAAGVVEYDAEPATVRYRARGREDLETLLRFVADELH